MAALLTGSAKPVGQQPSKAQAHPHTRIHMSGLLQQLAAWWPAQRRQAAAAAAPPGGAQVLDGVQDSAAAAASNAAAAASGAPNAGRTSSKEHLIIMVHGLFGTRDNWRAISGLLAEQLDADSTLLFVSHCNEREKTFEGIDACGERLAQEIRTVTAQHPGLRRISILGHSMGGLISRYAAGRLYDPSSGTVAGLAPCHFIAMATPHLGCDAQYNPAQVPLINWISAVPAIGGVVGSVVSELAAPVSGITLGRAGLQFFLQDAQVEQQRGASSSGGGSGGSSGQRHQPLLYRMTQDEEGLPFMSALAAFETRTLFANSSGDHLVGWANSSLRRLRELPQKNGRGTGVIREDPLELAWAPAQRPRLHASLAAQQLHSDEGRQVSEAQVLAAADAGELAEGSNSAQVAGVPSSGGVSSGGGRLGLDGQAAAGTAQHQLLLQQQQRQRQQPEPQRLQQTSAEVAEEEGATELAIPAAAAAATAGGGGGGAGGARSSGGGASSTGTGRAGSSSSSSIRGRGLLASEREQQVEEMLSRLQALSWRRVDVCFGATLLPMLSHQHIQMQRWWLNWSGAAVIKHLALQLAAMEQLRAAQQREQQQREQQKLEAPQAKPISAPAANGRL